ncbi:MAG TPA: hypothetical protein EYG85_05690 [Crocinitomix sp.]|nr:hypothetical protein [Crocinitomix sp.]HIP47772.1 hypothetical protein [Lutibacter sp.]
MSLRKIHISNSKARNTLINFKGFTPTSKAIKVDQNNKPVFSKKIIKGIANTSFEGLEKQYDNLDIMAEALIEGDPEINLEVTGQFLGQSPKVYINEDLNVVYRVNKIEKVFNPKGEFQEERNLKHQQANITDETPLKWSGKFFPIEKSFNKFVFVRTYQLFHDSGLTFDFLYNMSKELEDKKSFLLLGSGSKGTGPAIFQENGQSFRIFLEGRTKGNDYMLLMHLSNLEFKSLNNE